MTYDGPDTELLTPLEIEFMEQFSVATRLLFKLIGDGPQRENDAAEMCVHIHAIQRSVLSHAACRAYPGEYRLMGETLRKANHE